MKNCISLMLLLFTIASNAQNPLSKDTQVEIGLGYIQSNFIGGNELIRSFELRQNNLSYYIDENGNRANVGNYSTINGYYFTIGFYKPLKKIKGLMLGAMVNNVQTGSTPSIGGYEEAYFFNFVTASVKAKYYPFEKVNLFAKADIGLAAVFSKNRFINQNDEQEFFHQFGIGSSIGFELGYGFLPFKDNTKAFELQFGYRIANTRVEVNGIGNDQWQFGALSFGTAFIF